MKNDYILTLTGAQNWDGDTDTTEMRTDCSLSAEDGEGKEADDVL